MASTVRHVTIDCVDPYRLGLFWADVFGARLADDDHPGDPEAILDLGSFKLLFLANPDAKTIKNRMHFDLAPDSSREAEVTRLASLGAQVYEDHRRADRRGWVTMRDPEGNEFCVERSAAERE